MFIHSLYKPYIYWKSCASLIWFYSDRCFMFRNTKLIRHQSLQEDKQQLVNGTEDLLSSLKLKVCVKVRKWSLLSSRLCDSLINGLNSCSSHHSLIVLLVSASFLKTDEQKCCSMLSVYLLIHKGDIPIYSSCCHTCPQVQLEDHRMDRVQGGHATEPAGPPTWKPYRNVWRWYSDSGGVLCASQHWHTIKP